MVPLVLNAADAKRAIATAYLEAMPSAQLGGITLSDAQCFMLARAMRAIRGDGGCLVAEDVGRGKTFIALALAREYARPIVMAPAALRATWYSAASRAGIDVEFISHEVLSRNVHVASDADFVIVDESHHFRNTRTLRYSSIARAVARRRMVLLSATPLQNRSRDLAAQVALFAGERAFALDATAISKFVLKSGDDSTHALPVVAEPQWLAPEVDDTRVLARILAMPAPARPLDGGDAGALRLISLVRAWTSSRAALVASLRNRRRLATAIEQSVAADRLPTKREVLAWTGGEEAIQLGFASLLVSQSESPEVLNEIRASITNEHEALTLLSGVIRSTADPDVHRAVALTAVRARHTGTRILVFSEYAATVNRMFDLLVHEGGVGVATAGSCRIASGRITRDELLQRFAPVAQRATRVPEREHVTMLFTTDLLSEGVNLQDASIVVHLDLPWNPARLAQRVGRIRRPGGAALIHSYLMAPPSDATVLLKAEDVLARKLETARVVVTNAFDVLPRLTSRNKNHAVYNQPLMTSTETEGVLAALLRPWRDQSTCGSMNKEIGMQMASDCTWLAALDDGRLVASHAGCIGDSPHLVLDAVRKIDSSVALASASTKALREANEWVAAGSLRDTCGLAVVAGPLRDELDACITRSLARAPRHLLAQTASSATRLRNFLTFSLPLGLERELVDLARANAPLEVLVTMLDDSGLPLSRSEQSIASILALVESSHDGCKS